MLFPSRFSTQSVKSQFERALKTFNWLITFEAFTGGGGDADLRDDDLDDSNSSTNSDSSTDSKPKKLKKPKSKKDEYAIRLKGARSQGLDVGQLTTKAIADWYDKGWYDLFNAR